jgi:hypothetical protein
MNIAVWPVLAVLAVTQSASAVPAVNVAIIGTFPALLSVALSRGACNLQELSWLT